MNDDYREHTRKARFQRNL